MNYSINTMPKETREKIRESIQRNFEAIRKIAHLEIDELKELLDVSRQTIYNIEKRKSNLSNPQMVVLLLTLEKIAENNQQLEEFMNNVVFNLDEDEWIHETYENHKTNKKKIPIVILGAVAAAAAAATPTMITGPIGIIASAAMSSWIGDKIANSGIKKKDKE